MLWNWFRPWGFRRQGMFALLRMLLLLALATVFSCGCERTTESNSAIKLTSPDSNALSWDSGKFSQQAQNQLELLAKHLARPDTIERASGVLSADFECQPLRPTKLVEVLKEDGVVVSQLAIAWDEPESGAQNTASTADLQAHPDAFANTHAPGEVDKPELVPFVVHNPHSLLGVVVDEMSATLVGKWQYSTHTPPYVGIGYLHDQKSNKGASSVTFTPDLPKPGIYEVRLSHCYNVRRSTNTPVAIHHADGDELLRINQQDVPAHDKLFRLLGRFYFAAGTAGWVRISNEDTEGKYVIADAVQFLPMPENANSDASTRSMLESSRGLYLGSSPLEVQLKLVGVQRKGDHVQTRVLFDASQTHAGSQESRQKAIWEIRWQPLTPPVIDSIRVLDFEQMTVEAKAA